jgi:hypothetical protein
MSVYDVLNKWGVKNYRVLGEKEVEEITLGASILATGGGGDPEIGLLWTKKVLAEGKDIVMVDPMDVPDDILAASPACLGSALVLTEKPPSAVVLNTAIDNLQKYVGKDLEATIPLECGGVNSILAYAAAGEYGVPVIDVDGMNRAFPELQMTSWVTHGVHASPTVSVDNRKNVTIIDTNDDDLAAESIARKVAMVYGGISWVATYAMSGEELKRTSILNSQSIAWDIGKAVFKAREEHTNPIEELLKSLETTRNVKGYKAFEGKIVDIQRDFGSEINKGFTLGKVIMEGTNEYKGSTAELEFQNEWLIVKIDGVIKCLPPDLIALLDNETGEPIRTDIMKYGYRGSIILIPAHERMRTPKGIETFGPRYFGYDVDYTPVELLNEEE